MTDRFVILHEREPRDTLWYPSERSYRVLGESPSCLLIRREWYRRPVWLPKNGAFLKIEECAVIRESGSVKNCLAMFR